MVANFSIEPIELERVQVLPEGNRGAMATPGVDFASMRDRFFNFENVDPQMWGSLFATAYDASHPQHLQATSLMLELKAAPNSWIVVPPLWKHFSQTEVYNEGVLFFAIQVLEDTVMHRWKMLDSQFRTGMRSFVIDCITDNLADDTTYRKRKALITKLDVVLIEIIKQEFESWGNCITDLVDFGKRSVVICENVMDIFALLSEEAFVSKDKMTKARAEALQNFLVQQLNSIFSLCNFVLTSPGVPVSLQKRALEVLKGYLPNLPLTQVFAFNLLDHIFHFFVQADTRNEAMACIVEIASLTDPGNQNSSHLEKLYYMFEERMTSLVPSGVQFKTIWPNIGDREKALISLFAHFYSGFFKSHLALLEVPHMHQVLLVGMNRLISITEAPDDTIFKLCLEYWNHFSHDIYRSDGKARAGMRAASRMNRAAGLNLGSVSESDGRKALYDPILKHLRTIMITHMPQPKEVMIVEDEMGNAVREVITSNTEHYLMMRETLITLTNLDYEDTEERMLNKLSFIVDGGGWSFFNINTLCWAMGSISGAVGMSMESEKRFLVVVIKDLLGLCEYKKGKDNKAIIASNIMYVVGQYPRFLRAHWKFLKTVVNKLFEFMHEPHPGVQEMACETFVKIAKHCKLMFVQAHPPDDTVPFVHELISSLPRHTADLKEEQIYVYYEAVGYIIGSAGNAQRLNQMLVEVMAPPNQAWRAVTASVAQQARDLQAQGPQAVEACLSHQTVKDVLHLVNINRVVCASVGTGFMEQMGGIFADMLFIYKLYSENVTSIPTALTRSMKAVRQQILIFIEKFIASHKTVPAVSTEFIPALVDPIVKDFVRCSWELREPQVLYLFGSAITQLQSAMSGSVPAILNALFGSVVEMITLNVTEYPVMRSQFFSLLKSVSAYTPQVLFNNTALQMTIQSVVHALRHTDPSVADTGLEIAYLLLVNVKSTEYAQVFYQRALVFLVKSVMSAMTDQLHKSGFAMHCDILKHVFSLLPQVTVPLFDPNLVANAPADQLVTLNRQFLSGEVAGVLKESFPQLTGQQIETFLNGLFSNPDRGVFKQHLCDFLVLMKEFSPEEQKVQQEQYLFNEERLQEQATLKAGQTAVRQEGIRSDYEDMADL